MTKEEQLRRSKTDNPKKLGYIAWHNYVDWINEISNGMCQLCKKNPLDEMHHSAYGSQGADKDDRTLVGICRYCHLDCHKEKHGSVNSKAVKIGRANWRKYNE